MSRRVGLLVGTAIVSLAAISTYAFGQGIDSQAPSDDSDVILIVNGTSITKRQVLDYGSLFVDPTGGRTVSDADVIRALVNQELVIQVASELQVTVPSADIDARLKATMAMAGDTETPALRERVYLHMLFAAVQDRVLPAAVVTEQDVREFLARSQIEGLADPNNDDQLEAIRASAIAALTKERKERLWLSWLTNQQACASIEPRLPEVRLAEPSQCK